MKINRNSFAILGILLLLGLGYMIPTVIVMIEDNNLQGGTKIFGMEEIELNFNNVDLTEKLQAMPELLMNNVIVEYGEAKEDTSKYNMVQASVEEFFEIMHIEKEIEFEVFSVSYYVMMTDASQETVYPLWRCDAIDKDKNYYCFWIDDETGKVLAFEIPMNLMRYTEEAFYQLITNIGNYYGLSFAGLVENENDRNSYKSDYFVNAIRCVDEKEDIYLYIFKSGEKLVYNMYPGTISVDSHGDITGNFSNEN